MTRVVGYVRVSTELQVDNYSLGAQRHSIEQACAYHGHTLVRIYADEGASAYRDDLAKRPQFVAAIDAVLAGEADALMVDKLDRLARNARIFQDVMHRLGNRVIFVRENIDPTTPTGELVAGILAQAAQFFSRNLATETTKGKHERRAQGLWLGDLPYGYRKQDGDEHGKLPPIHDDAPTYTLPDGRVWSRADVVRSVFAQAARGETRASIVGDLAGRGINDLPRGRLNSILKSRFYLGQLPIRRSSRTEGADEWVPGKQPPLIDQETFDAVLAAAQANRRGPAVIRSSARVYPLSGLCLCGRCGGKMYLAMDHGTPRLMCSARNSSHLCDQVSVQAPIIEERVVEALARYAPPADIAQRVAEVICSTDEIDLSKEEAEVRDAQQRLTDLYLNFKHVSREQYEVRARELDQRLATIRAQTRLKPDVEELASLIHELPAAYRMADDRERNQLIRRVFRGLLIDNQQLVGTRPVPALDTMLRTRRQLVTLDLRAGRISAS